MGGTNDVTIQTNCSINQSVNFVSTQVLAEDLEKKIYEKFHFDAVFVCNGHNYEPFYPNIDGLEIFCGRKLHSHNYRQPEQMNNEKVVLVIGGGPSGKDIIFEIATTAKRVLFSHHRDLPNFILPPNVTQMPDVKRFSRTSVEFIDGRIEEIYLIFFCTGNT